MVFSIAGFGKKGGGRRGGGDRPPRTMGKKIFSSKVPYLPMAPAPLMLQKCTLLCSIKI